MRCDLDLVYGGGVGRSPQKFDYRALLSGSPPSLFELRWIKPNPSTFAFASVVFVFPPLSLKLQRINPNSYWLIPIPSSFAKASEDKS